MIPTREELAVFRRAEDLCTLVEPDRLGVSNEDFFNKAAGGLYQKLREAWVLSRVGIAISHAMSPVQVKVVDGPLLDGVIQFEDGSEWDFEVVTVLPPGCQPGVEYRKGQSPTQNISDFSGEPSDPSWPREPILAKVEKIRRLQAARHLVAYLNYGGGVPDLGKVGQMIVEAKNTFETTWLVTGAMFCLVFDSVDVGYPTGEWKPYLDWLPEECRP